MTDLLPWTIPDGREVLIAWLKPLGEVRDTRPTGAALPYRMVSSGVGPADSLTSNCIYAVHTFAATPAEASAAAEITHRRLMLLVGQFTGQQEVILDSGQVVCVDEIECDAYPEEVQWVEDNSIIRYVGEYRVRLRITAAT